MFWNLEQEQPGGGKARFRDTEKGVWNAGGIAKGHCGWGRCRPDKGGRSSTAGPSPPSILNEKEAQCIAAGRDVTDYLP